MIWFNPKQASSDTTTDFFPLLSDKTKKVNITSFSKEGLYSLHNIVEVMLLCLLPESLKKAAHGNEHILIVGALLWDIQ